jgi:hypothetical protein
MLFLEFTAAGNEADVLPNQLVYVYRTGQPERICMPQNDSGEQNYNIASQFKNPATAGVRIL